MTLRLALFASGGGTNLQAIIDACVNGTIKAEPVVVIGNNSRAQALGRARTAGITTVHLSSTTHPDPDELDRAIAQTLAAHRVDLVALAGYNKKLGSRVLDAHRNRILNIHPGLLPEYGGDGMYGARVHTSVLAKGDRESGATVHLVDELYDHGATIAEVRVPVSADDTADSLSARIREKEHILYVDTLRRIAAGELELP